MNFLTLCYKLLLLQDLIKVGDGFLSLKAKYYKFSSYCSSTYNKRRRENYRDYSVIIVNKRINGKLDM